MRLIFILFLVTTISCTDKNKSKKNTTSDHKSENLAAVLNTIWRTEQDPIRLRDSIGRIYGFDSKEFVKQNTIYHKNHDLNERKVREILDTQGWPDRSLIGKQGNLTLCNVLQHSSTETRIKYLPLMRQAVKNNQLSPWLLARTEDRIATDKGEFQIYGGQMKYYPETKSFNVWPIFDPVNVDKRRAEIGLEPISEYLKNRFDFEWNLEEQILRSEKFEKERQSKKQ